MNMSQLIDAWLIWSCENSGWWKPEGRGYTKSVIAAGQYSFQNAMQIVRDENECHDDEQEPNELLIPLSFVAKIRADA
jgi:hypothetical protein